MINEINPFSRPPMTMVSPSDDEIKKCWLELPNKDPEAQCPCCGEVWQYMGSFKYQTQGWVHEFRHRHFEGKTRMTCKIPASAGWVPEKELIFNHF